MPATPRCPYCNAQGLNHLALQRLEGFGLVYCGNCGAIYGVVPLLSADRPSKPGSQIVDPPAPPIEIEKKANLLPPKPLRHPLTPHDSSHSQKKAPPLSSNPGEVETEPDQEPSPQPLVVTPSAAKPPTGSLEEVGGVDLSHKLPYDPEAIANRMRVAGTGQGSRFLRVAVDVGPPLCPQHKIEMVKTTIPAGYQNAGREVWLCLHFKSCREWELAK